MFNIQKMEEYWFKIKVSDLLLNPWSKDTISFEKKFVKEIDWLNKDWISWTVFLQSLDKNTIHVEIKDLKATLNDICDMCGSEFEREIFVKNIKTKFVHKDKLLNPDEKIRDEEFVINPKDEIIDLGEFIFQTIIEQSPIVKKCNKCESTDSDNNDDEEITGNTATTIKWL